MIKKELKKELQLQLEILLELEKVVERVLDQILLYRCKVHYFAFPFEGYLDNASSALLSIFHILSADYGSARYIYKVVTYELVDIEALLDNAVKDLTQIVFEQDNKIIKELKRAIDNIEKARKMALFNKIDAGTVACVHCHTYIDINLNRRIKC